MRLALFCELVRQEAKTGRKKRAPVVNKTQIRKKRITDVDNFLDGLSQDAVLQDFT